jgi:xylose dehydrogenase (NAD/NADP)
MPEPLRWGILGTGGINRRFVPGLREAGHTIAIVGSRTPAKGQAFAAEYGAARAGSYEEVLGAADVDVIYNCLPNGLHAEWSIRAAEAGKHVLCEKPLAPSVADCEAMVAAAQRHGTHLVEAFMYRYHPQWEAVWAAMRSGRLGQVQLLRASFQFPVRDRQNVRLSRELSGGSIQDAGCYCVNVSRWILGEPTRVRGVALDRQDVGVDTHNAAVLEYASGALAVLTCSFETVREQVVQIYGDRGSVTVPVPFTPVGEVRLLFVDADGERTEVIPPANSYGLECLAMERLIRTGAPMLTPASDAAGTQAVIAAWKGS